MKRRRTRPRKFRLTDLWIPFVLIVVILLVLQTCLSTTPPPPLPPSGQLPSGGGQEGAMALAQTPNAGQVGLASVPMDMLESLRRTTPPARDLYDLARRLKPGVNISESGVRLFNYSPGQMDTFWVADHAAGTFFVVTATLAYTTAHGYFYVQEDLEVAPDLLSAAARAFEEGIYPCAVELLGSESSGSIAILNARIPGVGGYYSTVDQFPKVINPYSNERPIIYINVSNVAPGSPFYNATLAHELQHLIHSRFDPSEDTWVNEGLSELAAWRCAGYAAAGVGTFSRAPDTQLTAWAKGPGAVAHYEAARLFLRYFFQHYGGAQAIRRLVALPARGPEAFDEYLAQAAYGLIFDQVFRDWVIANYLDDSQLAAGQYGYDDLEVQVQTESVAQYPAHGSATVHQYAADYIYLPPNGVTMTIYFTGTPNVRLVPNQLRSGGGQWWSNRGDGIDARLTRGFDLRGLSTATLHFWAWFDIEEEFDYAYVLISTDGGRTWVPLAGRHTTMANPNGASYGPAYTGISGRGDTPKWVEEEIALSRYVGQEMLLRFEYVTDDAYNAPGFVVDDIRIPELGYWDTAASDGGWMAEGFVRSDNLVPQEFIVQLIRLGEPVAVEAMVLNGERRGQMFLSPTAEGAVLVIAAMAPRTTEMAAYQYSVGP